MTDEKPKYDHIAFYKNPRIYLSGRMSGLPRKKWFDRFEWWQFFWEMKGYHVVNPAKTFIAYNPWWYWIIGYRWTLWVDLRLLKRCTHIFMVGDDWQQSKGARLERMKAREWKIKELTINN